MKPDQAFATVLKRIRTDKGLSQEQLALDSALDRTFISLLERGQRQPSLNSIFQISAALKIKASTLLELVQEEMGANKDGHHENC